jgi:cohesin complex subunit SA-1/2
MNREDLSDVEDENNKKRPNKVSKTTNDDFMDEEDDSSEAEDNDDEDFYLNQKHSGKKRKKTQRSSKKSQGRVSTARSIKHATAAKKRSSVAAPRKNATKGRSTVSNAGKINKVRIISALNALSRKVLAPEESPDTCLLAALLASSKPIPNIPSTEIPTKQVPSYVERNDGSVASKIVSLTKVMTLPQLDGIARQLVRNFDPNAMHIQLLNLLFRSVGGSTETNLTEGTDLEELEDEKWDDIMSKVVTAMRDETEADQTILCADYPPPLPHEQQQKIGLIAYRAIYKDFWYRLGHVLLSHLPSTVANTNSLIMKDDDDEGDLDQESDEESLDSFDFDHDGNDEKMAKSKTKKKKSAVTRTKEVAPTKEPAREKFSSNLFQLEMMRDLIARVTEFVTVGQPDLRSSGTLAIFQLGKACMERTVDLETKIQIATRQLKAAKQNQAASKMEHLKNNIDAWKRHKAELQEIVIGQVIQAVFINRYRDSNATLRKESLDALSVISLIRPDIFLVDTYLKYFGWMTHDKDSAVRTAAIHALLVPFKMYQEQMKYPRAKKGGSSSPYQIEIKSMQHVTVKFLPRLVDCTHDSESVGVQEVAMKLLLEMLQVEFLEECEDDELWDSINMKCVDMHSSPQLRKDALYFVLNQLAAFDTANDHVNEKKLVERLASLAGW